MVCSSEIDGSLHMKWLRNNHSIRHSENISRSEDRVESAESCIIESDIFLRYTCLDEGLLHGFRFIVSDIAIISGDEDMRDFLALIEFLRRIDTSREKKILPTTDEILTRSEEDSYLLLRDGFDISIDPLTHREACVDPCEWYEKESEDEEGENFSDHS